MEQKVNFRDDQELQGIDFSNIETFTEESIDHIVSQAIEPNSKFYGFPVNQTSATDVNVAGGWLWGSGKIYVRDDVGGVSLNLFGQRPITNQKIVAIVATPIEIESDIEARDFLINAETDETEPREVTMSTLRQVNVGFVAGQENATPVAPSVDLPNVVIALVTMGPAGILSIDYVESNRIKSLSLAHQRLDDFDVFRAQIGSQLDTLRSDLAALGAAINGTAKQFFVEQLAFDVAQIKDKIGIPTNAAAYDSDNFLDVSKSDTANAAYYARVEEGIRFPAIQTQIAQIGLNNVYDPNVSVNGNLCFAAYTEKARISVVGNDRQVGILTYQFQTVETKRRTITRKVLRWGTAYNQCTNSSWWQTGRYDPQTGIFTRDGETFTATYLYTAWPGHDIYRVQQFWTDTIRKVYWDQITVTETVAGAVVAQTFLNSQTGYLSRLNLYFSSIGPSGNVQVMITETNTDGTPNFSAVLAKTTLNLANIKLYPQATPVPMALPYLDGKTRYAIVLSTNGNHTVCQVKDNKYGEGSFFYSTDNAFAQGDLAYDLAFEAYFCAFKSPRVEVMMQPLTLAGGIANIEINADQVIPDCCDIVHQVFVNSQWVTMEGGSAITGLPALVQYKVILKGTTNVMPVIALGSQSEVTTWRPANNFTHVSIARTLTAASSSIKVKVRHEWWSPLHHSAACVLLTGAGFTTANAVTTMTETTPIEDANAREREYNFTLGAAVTNYKIKLTGTTDAVLSTFHVARRTDIAF